MAYWIDFFDEDRSPVCCYYAVEGYSFLFLFSVLMRYGDFVVLRPWDPEIIKSTPESQWNANRLLIYL